MKLTTAVSIALASLVLAACASAPQLQSLQPRSAGVSGYALSQSPTLEQTNHTIQHLDKDKSVLYFQNYGGGGVGLGVLLGPIGVAANMSMIESNTKKDAEQLQAKINVKPREMFVEAAKQKGLDLSSTSGLQKARITPYLYISKTEGEALLVSSALLVEHGSGADQWTGKYMYQLPVRYSISELSQLSQDATERLKAAAADGFSLLVTHLGAESQERLAQERKILFKSDLLNPRFDFEMIGSLISDDSDIVWIRTFGGVYGVRKSNITFSFQKS